MAILFFDNNQDVLNITGALKAVESIDKGSSRLLHPSQTTGVMMIRTTILHLWLKTKRKPLDVNEGLVCEASITRLNIRPILIAMMEQVSSTRGTSSRCKAHKHWVICLLMWLSVEKCESSLPGRVRLCRFFLTWVRGPHAQSGSMRSLVGSDPHWWRCGPLPWKTRKCVSSAFMVPPTFLSIVNPAGIHFVAPK